MQEHGNTEKKFDNKKIAIFCTCFLIIFATIITISVVGYNNKASAEYNSFVENVTEGDYRVAVFHFKNIPERHKLHIEAEKEINGVLETLTSEAIKEIDTENFKEAGVKLAHINYLNRTISQLSKSQIDSLNKKVSEKVKDIDSQCKTAIENEDFGQSEKHIKNLESLEPAVVNVDFISITVGVTITRLKDEVIKKRQFIKRREEKQKTDELMAVALENFNSGDILAAHANMQKAQAISEDIDLELVETITNAKNDYDIAERERVEREEREERERTEREEQAKIESASKSNQQLVSSGSGSSGTVYLSATGSKYHKFGCRTLKSTKIPTTAESAKSRGYTACKVCDP